MEFEFYLSNQLKMHPSMQYQDIAKLCYQSAFGAEHILSDIERARAYLCSEFESIVPTDEPLFEQISPQIVRVNLGAWKREERDSLLLFEAFKNSSTVSTNGNRMLMEYISVAERVMLAKMKGFSLDEWRDFLDEYREAGMPPIHHSDAYRENENPHYRIVKIIELEKIL